MSIRMFFAMLAVLFSWNNATPLLAEENAEKEQEVIEVSERGVCARIAIEEYFIARSAFMSLGMRDAVSYFDYRTDVRAEICQTCGTLLVLYDDGTVFVALKSNEEEERWKLAEGLLARIPDNPFARKVASDFLHMKESSIPMLVVLSSLDPHFALERQIKDSVLPSLIGLEGALAEKEDENANESSIEVTFHLDGEKRTVSVSGDEKDLEAFEKYLRVITSGKALRLPDKEEKKAVPKERGSEEGVSF